MNPAFREMSYASTDLLKDVVTHYSLPRGGLIEQYTKMIAAAEQGPIIPGESAESKKIRLGQEGREVTAATQQGREVWDAMWESIATLPRLRRFVGVLMY